MKTLKLIALSILFLNLFGCGPIYQKKFTYYQPRSNAVRQCIASNCERNKMMCERNCSERNSACKWRAYDQARVDYRQYVRQQRRQNLPVKKSISDFNNDSYCDTSCGCNEVYRRCYQTCGGKVTSKSVCVAFCDQGK